MALTKISTFDDWVDYFKAWQNDIGLNNPQLRNWQFETKFGPVKSSEIEFGHFKGQPKWERVTQIPDQRIRDGLLSLIVYQGDTEFASVEQQRNLFETAPNDYDLSCLTRVMAEEMRHGWQMAYLLATYFGSSGKLEAQKLLERRSFKHNRLLGSFNEDVDNWLDFFVYTEFVDRDGKFQLTMLSTSAFKPLAQSMWPMLKEESFHLGTGNDGLRRMLRAGKIPTTIVQKYFNKWLPTAYDLFGTDHSSSAQWNYVWGLKGRFDEHTTADPLDKEHLNERARTQYYQEAIGLIEAMNKLIPEGQPKLYTPDLKFHRAIGDFAGQLYSVTGELLSPEQYQQHLRETLPQPGEVAQLQKIFKEKDWIAPKK